MKRIDIVVPCYNEEECICLLFERVEKVFSNIEGYKFRIVYVDDGSVDETLTKIKRLAEDIGEDTIKYISLSRNFGKEAAMFAGLQYADGDGVRGRCVGCSRQSLPFGKLYGKIQGVWCMGKMPLGLLSE